MSHTSEVPEDHQTKEYRGIFNVLVQKPFDQGARLVFPGYGITIQKIEGEVVVTDEQNKILPTEETLKDLNLERLLDENEG